MSDIVLYRKYRPQTFSEVVGQDQVVRVLAGSVKEGAVAHAYLFVGSRGTGKTSVARILAKEVGTSANDLYEMDAASNRGIDEVRELRDAVRTLPFESKYKVYIIDEVHMLTKEAFNALLKTLEEPPAHVIFILATTELHKIPETIISRCQTFHFQKPSTEILREVVERVAKKEKFKINKEAAELIAYLGDGSFRDALGMLQKVISFSPDREVSAAEVREITGAPSGELINDIVTGLVAKDANRALSAINQAVKQNIDIKVLLKLITRQVRYAMFFQYAPDLAREAEKTLTSEEIKFLKEITKQVEPRSLPDILRILLECYEQLSWSSVPQLPLELATVRICS